MDNNILNKLIVNDKDDKKNKIIKIFNKKTLKINKKVIEFINKELDINQRIKRLESVTMSDVNDVINATFDLSTLATATVGSKRTAINVNI